jgi:hypothetical protein
MSSSCTTAEHGNYLRAKASYLAARVMIQSGGGRIKKKQRYGSGLARVRNDMSRLHLDYDIDKVTPIHDDKWSRWLEQCPMLRHLQDEVVPKLLNWGVAVIFVATSVDLDLSFNWNDYERLYRESLRPGINHNKTLFLDIVVRLDKTANNIAEDHLLVYYPSKDNSDDLNDINIHTDHPHIKDIELELMKLPFYKPSHPVDNNPLVSINDAQFSMGVKLPCTIDN